MFSLFDLHFTEELLHHLGDGGLLDAKDLHHCIDTVAHKQRFLKDQMFWQLLKSDGQVPSCELHRPRPAHDPPPYPPPRSPRDVLEGPYTAGGGGVAPPPPP